MTTDASAWRASYVRVASIDANRAALEQVAVDSQLEE